MLGTNTETNVYRVSFREDWLDGDYSEMGSFIVTGVETARHKAREVLRSVEHKIMLECFNEAMEAIGGYSEGSLEFQACKLGQASRVFLMIDEVEQQDGASANDKG